MELSAFVLVHSPLVGPSSWLRVAEMLRAHGCVAAVPSLAGAPPTYAGFAAAVRRALPPGEVVLVVHSGAGGLVPSVVEQEQVRAVVFVDAVLPYPGRRWLDTVPAAMVTQLRALVDEDGLVAPWHEWLGPEALAGLMPDAGVRAAFCAEVPRVPWGFLDEGAPALDPWPQVPCGYLQLSDGYDDEAALVRRRGWPVDRFDGHHLSAVSDPEAVAAAILRMAERVSKPMQSRRFSTTVVTGLRGRVHVPVPFHPDAVWGAKPAHHVHGTVGGQGVRAVVEPLVDGWGITLGPAWQRDCGVAPGDVVDVVLAPEGPQRGDLADDLAAALEADPAAGAFFDSLAQFYRRAYLRWIDATTRRPHLRAERIAQVVALLAAGVKERPKA